MVSSFIINLKVFYLYMGVFMKYKDNYVEIHNQINNSRLYLTILIFYNFTRNWPNGNITVLGPNFILVGQKSETLHFRRNWRSWSLKIS